jgi:hypothetical protein
MATTTHASSFGIEVTLTYQEARVEMDHPIVEDPLVATAGGEGREESM